jgi:uncharacterized membrane protein YqhA
VFQRLLKIRYLAVVIVILAVLHALAFLVMGAKSAFKGYMHLFDREGESRPGLELLHSLDFMFISLVLIVLALGIARLFLLDPGSGEVAHLPEWLRIESISELKVLLWETILTSLLIIGLSDLTEGILGKLDWSVLLTPVAILILALSLFFMKKA